MISRSDVAFGLFPLELSVEVPQQGIEFGGEVHVLVFVPCLCGLAG